MIESIQPDTKIVLIKGNEWYTPAKHIEAARQVMGTIDLDPASCEQANKTVKAAKYYSIEDDGLSKEWLGNIWLNPPYGKIGNNKSGIEPWVKRVIWEYTQGHIEAAIVLTTADTDAGWFQLLWEYLICFPLQRVYFSRPDGSIDSQIMGNVFTYLGPNENAFIKHFSQFGTVVKRVSPPPAKPVNRTLWEAE